MWLKNTFPACTSKAGKKKIKPSKTREGKMGLYGRYSELVLLISGAWRRAHWHPGSWSSSLAANVHSSLLMVSAVGLLSEGTWMWERLVGRGETHTVFLDSELSLAPSHGRYDDVWLCASSWWRGLCALGVSPSDTGPCHRWATNRCWCHCDHCYTGGLEPHSPWHEENLSLILEIPSAF